MAREYARANREKYQEYSRRKSLTSKTTEQLQKLRTKLNEKIYRIDILLMERNDAN